MEPDYDVILEFVTKIPAFGFEQIAELFFHCMFCLFVIYTSHSETIVAYKMQYNKQASKKLVGNIYK